MPELHANQIRWEAPEPQKVAFDKPDYTPLADAFTRLGAVADEIGQRQRDLLDDDLKADLKLAEDEANQIIENAASADADYDQLSEMMLSKVQGAFYKYDEATRTRFTRENKTYFDELQLAVTEKILQKKSKQLINEVKINIPLWASEVFTGQTNKEREQLRKDGINKIQKALKGLASPEQIAALEYEYNNSIDKANINNLITAGTDEALAEAKTFINNPKKAASLDPYERSVYNARIIAKEQENAKEKAKAEDPESLAVIQEYARYSAGGNTPAALDMYQAVQLGGKIPVVSQDENDTYVVQFIDTAKMPEKQRLEIINEFKKYDALNPKFEQDKAAYNAEVSEALVLAQKYLDEASSDQDSILQHMTELANNPMFRYVLPEGDREKVMGYINEQLKSRVEASLGEEQQYTVNTNNLIVPSTAVTILGEYVSGAPFGYNKKVGNPADLLTGAIGTIGRGANGISSDNGGMMASLMRNQTNMVNTSPYELQEVSKAASMGRALSTGPTNPYKHNLTALIIGTANIWQGRFARDMQKNSVAELGLYNKVLLPAFRDNGLLAGTRFNQTNLTIEKAFSQWSAELKSKQIYNNRVSKDNEKEVYRFFEILVGNQELTSSEKDRVKAMLDYTKTGQANEDWGDEAAYLFTTEAPKTRGYSDANQKPNFELMKTMTTVRSSDRVERALKNSNL